MEEKYASLLRFDPVSGFRHLILIYENPRSITSQAVCAAGSDGWELVAVEMG